MPDIDEIIARRKKAFKESRAKSEEPEKDKELRRLRKLLKRAQRKKLKQERRKSLAEKKARPAAGM